MSNPNPCNCPPCNNLGTYVQDLCAQRVQLMNMIVAAENQLLAAQTKENTSGLVAKPDYNIDGQQVSWARYQEVLINQITQMFKNLENLNRLINLANPYQFVSAGW